MVVAEPPISNRMVRDDTSNLSSKPGGLGGGLSADQLGHTCPCLAEKGMSQQKPTRNQSSRTA